MTADHNEFVVFSDEPEPVGGNAGGSQPEEKKKRSRPWRILIVDDDKDVHSATEFALAGLEILDSPLEFLHAYSSVEAIDLLMSEDDVAVILLDVVMENEEAGLSAVSTIRQDLGLTNTQIILRTGQPGYAPELETIRRYDINDYRTKSELSRVKLYTALTASVRAYEQLCRIDKARKGLGLVVGVGPELLAAKSDQEATEIILRSTTQFFQLGDDAALVIRDKSANGTLTILGGTGAYQTLTGKPAATLDALSGIDAEARINTAFRDARNMIDPDAYVLNLSGSDNTCLALFVPNQLKKRLASKQLIDVFCVNISMCAANRRLVNNLIETAFNDRLTGLANRRAFVDELDRRLSSVPRDNVAVILLDVDHFAETNDMFGHGYGDQLLIGIAKRLRQAMPEDVLVARLAADNFALIGTPDQLAPEPIRKLLLAQPFVWDDEERLVSVSSSYVLASDAEETADGNALLKDASIVIKRAKQQGLGQHINYTPDFRATMRDHSRTLHELGLAFRRQELYLVFQPQLSLADKKVVGVEALLRWKKADGTFVPPDKFIPIAEKSGLILPIGQWVLTTAVDALLVLREKGYRDLRMAVNVSAPQLSTPRFLAHLDTLLALHSEIIPHLELEVTESVAVLGFDEVFAQLSAIRARGLSLAIDDFGTGYSSLSYLDRLPADVLKIDRAFVAAMLNTNDGPRIAEMIIPLGRQLKMKVLAEGVEKEEEAAMLLALGCDEAQGYLFAKPMPLDDLVSWLGNRA